MNADPDRDDGDATEDAPRHIVVGIDSSPESTSALDWARAIGEPGDRISVIHAWDVPIVTGYDIAVVVDSTAIEAAAASFLAEMIAGCDDPRLVAVPVRGHPGRSLVEQAEGASMVVVGHRGSSRMSLMLGSTANYVAHHTDTPLVVVRGRSTDGVRNVVVGVDDHDFTDDGKPCENESVRALRWAASLPGVKELRVLHSWFLPALAAGPYSMLATDLDEMDSAAGAVAQRVIDAVGVVPEGVELVLDPARGTPGFALIEASRDADLVVVGSRGRGGFAEVVLGSTSAEVLAHSHTPVAVIR